MQKFKQIFIDVVKPSFYFIVYFSACILFAIYPKELAVSAVLLMFAGSLLGDVLSALLSLLIAGALFAASRLEKWGFIGNRRLTDRGSLWVVFIAGFVLTIHIQALNRGNAIPNWWLISSTLLLIILFGQRALARRRKGVKVALTVSATSFFGKPREAKLSRYLIFLRPFATDGQILIQPRWISFSQYMQLLQRYAPSTVYLEERISIVLYPDSNLVKIGERDVLSNYLGTGAANFTNAEWFDKLKAAAPEAKAICLVPLVQKGTPTYDEIVYLAGSQLLCKTVYVMPQDLDGKRWSRAVDMENAELWEASRRLLAQDLGLMLPPYAADGGFIVSYQGRLQRFNFVMGGQWTSATAIKALLVNGRIRRSCLDIAMRLSASAWLVAMMLLSVLAFHFSVSKGGFDGWDISRLASYVLVLGLFAAILLPMSRTAHHVGLRNAVWTPGGDMGETVAKLVAVYGPSLLIIIGASCIGAGLAIPFHTLAGLAFAHGVFVIVLVSRRVRQAMPDLHWIRFENDSGLQLRP